MTDKHDKQRESAFPTPDLLVHPRTSVLPRLAAPAAGDALRAGVAGAYARLHHAWTRRQARVAIDQHERSAVQRIKAHDAAVRQRAQALSAGVGGDLARFQRQAGLRLGPAAVQRQCAQWSASVSAARGAIVEDLARAEVDATAQQARAAALERKLNRRRPLWLMALWTVAPFMWFIEVLRTRWLARRLVAARAEAHRGALRRQCLQQARAVLSDACDQLENRRSANTSRHGALRAVDTEAATALDAMHARKGMLLKLKPLPEHRKGVQIAGDLFSSAMPMLADRFWQDPGDDAAATVDKLVDEWIGQHWSPATTISEHLDRHYSPAERRSLLHRLWSESQAVPVDRALCARRRRSQARVISLPGGAQGGDVYHTLERHNPSAVPTFGHSGNETAITVTQIETHLAAAEVEQLPRIETRVDRAGLNAYEQTTCFENPAQVLAYRIARYRDPDAPLRLFAEALAFGLIERQPKSSIYRAVGSKTAARLGLGAKRIIASGFAAMLASLKANSRLRDGLEALVSESRRRLGVTRARTLLEKARKSDAVPHDQARALDAIITSLLESTRQAPQAAGAELESDGESDATSDAESDTQTPTPPAAETRRLPSSAIEPGDNGHDAGQSRRPNVPNRMR